MSTTEKLAYSPAEFAVATSFGLSTVRLKIARGEIDVLRVGRRILIPAAEFGRLANRAKDRCSCVCSPNPNTGNDNALPANS